MKQVRQIILAIAMLLLIVGCQQEAQREPEVQKPKADQSEKEKTEEIEKENVEEEKVEDVAEIEEVVKARGIENYPVSLYDETTFDLDGDGEEEQIEMYVNAEQDEKGEFAWDDGHNWLFVVKDGDQTYPLYDGWVQLGTLKFWVIETDETPMVILLKTGTAEFTLQTFTYNNVEQGFIKETQFNPEFVNFFYHSK
ncbi:hypothetical protein SM124_06265 [Bacillus sp. 31A1R]|uniref:Lipoprotein n=1 Tax=Robertmurraya mangrovi TaxID=3098077 RepID=A0ABU5IW16_9BACI|nr:hypothetical protein [Bacillus sp. 31A1R]MDZ5471347.1 hypothetical protein [Bacillus sp. 31A1R]